MAAKLVGLLKSPFRRSQQSIALTAASAVVCLAVLVPFACLLAETWDAGGAAARVLVSAAPWRLLLRSVVFSVAVTSLALVIGVPLGVLLARTDVPARRLAWVIHSFPLFLPPFLPALGWFYLFGTNGFLGTAASSRLLFSECGLIAVLGLAFSPVVTSLVGLGVLGVDASLEDAARCVAGPGRVAARILLPAAAPAVAMAGIVVFAMTVSELAVPSFLRVEVFPAAVFARLGGLDYAPGEAFALALPLLPVALALLWLEQRFVGRRSFAVLGLRSLSRSPMLLGRRWRRPAIILCWLVALVSAAPVAALAVRAGTGGLASLPAWIGGAPWNSLRAGIAAATLITGLGLVLGHALARRLPGSGPLDTVVVLGFVAPAPVIGVGLVAAWNRPATQLLYGSAGILVLGLLARYAVIGLRTVAASVAQASPSFEEAAAVGGAGYWRRLTGIVLPLHARGVGLAWLLALVFCLRDLETSILFYPPGGEPLPVRIFTLEANGPEPVVAALAVVQAGLVAAVFALGSVLIFRQRTT
ncbi:MAG: ABC transporter permease [Candidatus Polarisedimenticolia bacterium]